MLLKETTLINKFSLVDNISSTTLQTQNNVVGSILSLIDFETYVCLTKN